VAQELVAQSFALVRVLDQPGDVHEARVAGVVRFGWKSAESRSSRSSRTGTTPTLGSMVQKG
jgi:hypothetical protein